MTSGSQDARQTATDGTDAARGIVIRPRDWFARGVVLAKGAELPEAVKDRGPVRYLTAEQEQRFIEAAKRDRLSALWHLLLDTGLRPGEAFSLRWEGAVDDSMSCIDLDAKLVHVRSTLRRVGVKKEQECGWTVTDPKTENSKREVPICDDTVAELRRWKKQQAAERLKVGPLWQDCGFVFTTEVGTPLGNNVGRLWSRVLRGADGGKGDLGTWGEQPAKRRSGDVLPISGAPS